MKETSSENILQLICGLPSSAPTALDKSTIKSQLKWMKEDRL